MRSGSGSIAPESTRPTGSPARGSEPGARGRPAAGAEPGRVRCRRRGRAGRRGVAGGTSACGSGRRRTGGRPAARRRSTPSCPPVTSWCCRTIASYDLGAGLGVPFLTAHRCLTVNEDGPQQLGPGLLAGRVVLVAGGAGAVGNAAIQLARWSEATVITTVSSDEKAELARRAGADHIVDYKKQDVVAAVKEIAPDGVNTIVEVSPAVNAVDRRRGARAARHGGGLRQQRRQRRVPPGPTLDGAQRALAVRARLQRAGRLAGPGDRRRDHGVEGRRHRGR